MNFNVSQYEERVCKLENELADARVELQRAKDAQALLVGRTAELRVYVGVNQRTVELDVHAVFDSFPVDLGQVARTMALLPSWKHQGGRALMLTKPVTMYTGATEQQEILSEGLSELRKAGVRITLALSTRNVHEGLLTLANTMHDLIEEVGRS